MDTQSSEQLFTRNDLYLGGDIEADVPRAKQLPLDLCALNKPSSPPPASGPVQVTTVRGWGETWLSRRSAAGIKLAKDDRRILETHVFKSRWADESIVTFARTKAIAREWWRDILAKTNSNPTYKKIGRQKLLSASTLRNIRQCVRALLAEAIEEELIPSHAFTMRALKVPKSRKARVTEEICVLYPHEQLPALALFDSMPEQWIVAFALATGLRSGEQWALRDEAIHLEADPPYIDVRFGGVQLTEPPPEVTYVQLDGAFFTPTKGGRTRRVYLNRMGVEALRAWLALRSGYAVKNRHKLVFPTRTGAPRRCRTRVFRGFRRVSKMLGRPFTWHGLRHSCASSLLGGWWGESGALIAVRDHLGHSTSQVTERYLHIARSALPEMIAQAPGLRIALGSGVKMVDSNETGLDEVGETSVDPASEEGLIAQLVELRTFNTEPTGTKTAENAGGAEGGSVGPEGADAGGDAASGDASETPAESGEEPPRSAPSTTTAPLTKEEKRQRGHCGRDPSAIGACGGTAATCSCECTTCAPPVQIGFSPENVVYSVAAFPERAATAPSEETFRVRVYDKRAELERVTREEALRVPFGARAIAALGGGTTGPREPYEETSDAQLDAEIAERAAATSAVTAFALVDYPKLSSSARALLREAFANDAETLARFDAIDAATPAEVEEKRQLVPHDHLPGVGVECYRGPDGKPWRRLVPLLSFEEQAAAVDAEVASIEAALDAEAEADDRSCGDDCYKCRRASGLGEEVAAPQVKETDHFAAMRLAGPRLIGRPADVTIDTTSGGGVEPPVHAPSLDAAALKWPENDVRFEEAQRARLQGVDAWDVVCPTCAAEPFEPCRDRIFHWEGVHLARWCEAGQKLAAERAEREGQAETIVANARASVAGVLAALDAKTAAGKLEEFRRADTLPPATDALDCPKQVDGEYECARTRDHEGECLPLYGGVPIGEQWSERYKAWARGCFEARCAAEHRTSEVKRETCGVAFDEGGPECTLPKGHDLHSCEMHEDVPCPNEALTWEERARRLLGRLVPGDKALLEERRALLGESINSLADGDCEEARGLPPSVRPAPAGAPSLLSEEDQRANQAAVERTQRRLAESGVAPFVLGALVHRGFGTAIASVESLQRRKACWVVIARNSEEAFYTTNPRELTSVQVGDRVRRGADVGVIADIDDARGMVQVQVTRARSIWCSALELVWIGGSNGVKAGVGVRPMQGRDAGAQGGCVASVGKDGREEIRALSGMSSGRSGGAETGRELAGGASSYARFAQHVERAYDHLCAEAEDGALPEAIEEVLCEAIVANVAAAERADEELEWVWSIVEGLEESLKVKVDDVRETRAELRRLQERHAGGIPAGDVGVDDGRPVARTSDTREVHGRIGSADAPLRDVHKEAAAPGQPVRDVASGAAVDTNILEVDREAAKALFAEFPRDFRIVVGSYDIVQRHFARHREACRAPLTARLADERDDLFRALRACVGALTDIAKANGVVQAALDLAGKALAKVVF